MDSPIRKRIRVSAVACLQRQPFDETDGLRFCQDTCQFFPQLSRPRLLSMGTKPQPEVSPVGTARPSSHFPFSQVTA